MGKVRIFFFILQIAFASNLLAEPSEELLLQNKWQVDLEASIKLSMPKCRDIEGIIQKSSKYKLCLPNSKVEGLKVELSGNLVTLKGVGTVQGPVLVNSSPPMIIMGGMRLKKGAISLNISKSGGFTMQGLGGMFEIEGLIIGVPASRPLEIDRIELEFTSPEDALLQLEAGNANASIVLRVNKRSSSRFDFVPSPTIYSIFPDNMFFHDFTGELHSADRLTLKLRDGFTVDLIKNPDS